VEKVCSVMTKGQRSECHHDSGYQSHDAPSGKLKFVEEAAAETVSSIEVPNIRTKMFLTELACTLVAAILIKYLGSLARMGLSFDSTDL